MKDPLQFLSRMVREYGDVVAFARRFDPQPFHVDEEQARQSLFGGLCASGWHTAAICMRYTVGSLAAISQFEPEANWRQVIGEIVLGHEPTTEIGKITKYETTDYVGSARMLDLDPGLPALARTSYLRELHDAGLQIAIDDFGAGWSSLSRLRLLPVQTLKIDRSFLREIPDDPDPGYLFIRYSESISVPGLARGLHLLWGW